MSMKGQEKTVVDIAIVTVARNANLDNAPSKG